MPYFQLNLDKKEKKYFGSEPSTERKPAITPTLVIGLGGTGTGSIRLLKRRLVWLWHRQAIENELDDIPDDINPQTWYSEVLRRYEMEGGPPTIQLLAVDTWPWSNRAGQVYLNQHEYAYLGGYNANRVLDNIENHPEIDKWWNWSEEVIQPGQIHSGARQIRAIGRLSFYRRYHEFLAKLGPQLERITSIQGKQDIEDRGYQVAPAQSAKRIYIITSFCGGTGAGAWLDVAARLRAEFLEGAIITGVFVLPSVFIPELGSYLQKDRVQANAYASLKELNYFQSHEYQLHLPREEPVSVSPLFNRLYLVGRQNKAGDSLNSIRDIHQLIANQIFLESLTHVGSSVWEYDVNITTERRKRKGRHITFNFSSFANSSLIVPRQQMLDYCEITYINQLITQGLLRKLNPEGENQIDAEVQLTQGRLIDIVSRFVEEGLWDGDRYAEEEFTDLQSPHSSVGPLEQLKQDVNSLTQRFGLRASLAFSQRVTDNINRKLQEGREIIKRQKTEVEEIGQRLHQLRTSEPWQARLNFWPLSLLMGAAVKSHRRRVALTQRRLQQLRGSMEEMSRERDEWSKLADSITPLIDQIYSRIKLLERIVNSSSSLAMERLFNSRPVSDQPPYEMMTMILGERYIKNKLAPKITSTTLNQHFGEDVRKLLQDKLVFNVQLKVAKEPEARTERHPIELSLFPTEIENLENTLKRIAGNSVHQAIKPEMFDLRRMLDGCDAEFTTRFHNLFHRCQPFWQYDLDIGGLSERDLEQVTLVGIGNSENESWKYLLRDFPEFQIVETDDPTRIDACRIEHGLPIQFLQEIGTLKDIYDKFIQEHAGPMQLDANWEVGKKQALPDLIELTVESQDENVLSVTHSKNETDVPIAPEDDQDNNGEEQVTEESGRFM